MRTTEDAERIRREMARIRSEIDHNVEDIVDNARILADWRYYVHAYPWAAAAAALAAGYLLVPRRIEIVSPDAETLLDLARRNRIVVEANPRREKRERSLLNSMFTLAANAAVRGLIAFVGQQAGKLFAEQAAEEEAQPV